MSEVAELIIESIAAGGDGVARREGLVVFVPRTAPGDRARVRYVPRGRFARGELLSLVEPAPVRVEPPCLHYTRDRCGGCQLQHLSYPAQLEAKARIVGDALQRIGRRRADVREVQPSPDQWRYRRKLTLALRRRGDGWHAGLHPFDAPGEVFALEDCPITAERVIALWRAVLAVGALLPAADELRGAVRVENHGSPERSSLVLEGGGAWPASSRFFSLVPGLSELWWIPRGGSRRLLHRRGEGTAPGASFSQVNTGVALEVREYVLAEVRRRAPGSAIDAYSGSGDTAVAVAEAGVPVTAIEIDPDAAVWCASRLPAGSRAITGRVETALPTALPADLVLLNPPRAGVSELVTSALSSASPRTIIYVSCNPATLARDLSRLPGFAIGSVRLFDMFPQTAHVETVCVLERNGGGSE